MVDRGVVDGRGSGRWEREWLRREMKYRGGSGGIENHKLSSSKKIY